MTCKRSVTTVKADKSVCSETEAACYNLYNYNKSCPKSSGKSASLPPTSENALSSCVR